MTDREANVTVDVTSRRPLEAVSVDVGVRVLVDVDELERAEIEAVGTTCPGTVEKVRMKYLKRQGHPPARRSAVDHTRIGRAQAAKSALNIRNELLGHGIAIGTVVVGVDLVRIPIRAVS